MLEDVRKMLENSDWDGVTIKRKKIIRRIEWTILSGYIYHINGCGILQCRGVFMENLCGWLHQTTTYYDPLLVSHIYWNSIKQYKINPELLRIDAGTENMYCQDLLVHFTDKGGLLMC